MIKTTNRKREEKIFGIIPDDEGKSHSFRKKKSNSMFLREKTHSEDDLKNVIEVEHNPSAQEK